MKMEKKGNIARVHYEKQEDGLIKIVSLENFLSAEDIHTRYGKSVFERYYSQEHNMCRYDGGPGFPTLHVKIAGRNIRGLYENHLYAKEEFTESIAKAKLCGIALAEAIKSVKGQTKVIEI